MKNFIKTLLVCISILIGKNSIAQGVKVDAFGYTGITSDYIRPFFYGIGYEQNLGTKISIGLTYKVGYAIDYDFYETQKMYSLAGSSSGSGYINYFEMWASTNWTEFSYTSKYFFDDNSSGGYYFSSGISMLNAENQYEVGNIYLDGMSYSSVLGITSGVYKQKITLLPVSLDLGTRSEFDGWYMDLYSGITFLPFGSKKTVTPGFLDANGVKTEFAPLSFHIAFAFGISWAD